MEFFTAFVELIGGAVWLAATLLLCALVLDT